MIHEPFLGQGLLGHGVKSVVQGLEANPQNPALAGGRLRKGFHFLRGHAAEGAQKGPLVLEGFQVLVQKKSVPLLPWTLLKGQGDDRSP